MSSLRRATLPSLFTKLTTSLVIACTLASVASAEAVRVPDAPTAPGAPASPDSGAPAHFAQPPHQMRAPIHDDMYALPALTRDAVRDALLKARHRNLAFFRAYQKAGVFPSNTFQPNKLNVWRDADGHFCAAATIIRSSDVALVDRVAEQNNFIRLADVKQGPLMDWILTSGFTQDEIAAIQEPFMPVTQEPAPVDPRIVDGRMRRIEDQRLLAKYKQVDAMIVRNQKASLDAATDRLMKNPALTARFMDIWAYED